MLAPKTTTGFTLFEVLVALVIFSLGLIGLAGLLAVSVQTNHSAYLRTQASFLAQSIADRMRANNIGLWNGNYVGTYTKATGGTANSCLNTASCTPALLAVRDLQVWSNQLGDFLPAATGTIACTVPPLPPTPDQITSRPPFQGQCTITIGWTESSLTGNGSAPPTETLAWVFQP